MADLPHLSTPCTFSHSGSDPALFARQLRTAAAMTDQRHSLTLTIRPDMARTICAGLDNLQALRTPAPPLVHLVPEDSLAPAPHLTAVQLAVLILGFTSAGFVLGVAAALQAVAP